MMPWRSLIISFCICTCLGAASCGRKAYCPDPPNTNANSLGPSGKKKKGGNQYDKNGLLKKKNPQPRY